MGELLEILPALVHGPEVHDAVAVAGEVDAPLPHHWRAARAIVVAGELFGVFGVGREAPDVLRGTASIALGVAALEGEAREEERAVVVGAVARLGEWHERRHVRSWVDLGELRVGERREMARRVENLSLGGPARDDRRATLEGAPRRRSAVDRHGIELRRSFVRGREGDGLSVG